MFCEAQTIIEPIHLQIISLLCLQLCRYGRSCGGFIPDECTNLNRAFAAKLIREVTRKQSTEPRATRHGSSDTTLHIRLRTVTLVNIVSLDLTRYRVSVPGSTRRPVLLCLLEITQIWFGRDNGRHGSNVKTKQTATNNGDGRDHVDVSHGIHFG